MKSFWDNVDKTDTCWNWLGPKTPRGYGQLKLCGKTVYAHRFAYTITHGEITDGLYVCHKCDNPSCVRPDHLFLGTQADNMKDRMDKVRKKKFGSSGAVGSPAEVVIAIMGVRPLARELKIAPSTVMRWKERGGKIPSRHHLSIIELSEGKLTADDIVYGR